MTLSHSLLVVFGLSMASLLPFIGDTTGTKLAPQSAAELTAPCLVTLTWTADTQAWLGGDWDGGVLAAANHVEQGFTDWRLPTVQELQGALAIPFGQPGSWGQDLSNPGGSGSGWTSKSQGNWAYRVVVVEDVNGYVIPSQSGQSSKVLKASNFARTKFVRP